MCAGGGCEEGARRRPRSPSPGMLLRLAVTILVLGIAAAWYAWVLYKSWPFALLYWPLWILLAACVLAWREHRRL